MKARIFKDPAKYQELLILLNAKASYMSISRHFQCDHTSVIYWARKVGIPAATRPIEIEFMETKVITPDLEHPILKAERLNHGKDCYEAYRLEARERLIPHFILPGGIVL